MLPSVHAGTLPVVACPGGCAVVATFTCRHRLHGCPDRNPMPLRFYVGLDNPQDAKHFERCMVSVNTLRDRVSDFPVNEWMMDSGAFTQISTHGRFLESPQEYAVRVRRWAACGQMVAAVSQDYMCEPFILAKTGLTTRDHQRMTVERYVAIREAVGDAAYILPVLQGFWPDEYLRHAEDYGDLLQPGMWVGVGSVCKRNSNVDEIEQVLVTIHRDHPNLRLHGFGVKLTALESSLVRECLYSADSMAWSRAARWEGRDQHDYREAKRFAERIETQTVRERVFQGRLF